MRSPSFSSLRTRLALLIVFGMIPVLGLTLFTYLREIRLVKSHIADDVERLTDLASAMEEDLIEGATQLTGSLARMPGIQEEPAESCARRLAAILAENPRYANLGVVSPDGRLLCSAVAIQQRADFSGRHWFQHAVEEQGLSLETCRFPDASSPSTLVFGCPILDGENRLHGVVFAALDPEEITRLAVQLRLPASAEMITLTCTGTILTYLPLEKEWMGQSARDAILVDTILNQGKGIASLPGLDGKTRLYAFSPLSSTVETDLFVAIGVPESLVFSEANKVLFFHFTGLGLVMLLALAAVWFGSSLLILRPVHALATAVQRLSAGDMAARTGLPHGEGELNRLAQSFDRMAEALEARTVELREEEARSRQFVEQLLQNREQLRSLASQLSLAEERARRRIATDLHDRVAQALAISRIRLGALAQSVASAGPNRSVPGREGPQEPRKNETRKSPNSTAELSREIEEIRQLIMQAIQDTRSLMFEISPPILYELGLEAALDWLAEQTQKRHGIQVTCEDDGEPKPLEDHMRVLLFQAAGELLANVAKHAHARHAKLTIERAGREVRVTVEDDGLGFDPSAIGPRRDTMEGFGLFSIRERLSHVGGRLDVESHPGSGARITLTAPVKNLPDPL